MARSRVLEFLIVLALVSVFVLWQRTPGEQPESAKSPQPALSAAPVREIAQHTVDGHYLGEQIEGSVPQGIELDPSEQLICVRGLELNRGAEKLFGLGANHDQVKAALGPANAFAHGGRAWGYWQNNWLPKGSGILVKFSHQGVTEIVMAKDWSKLATEHALDGISGGSEPVDGSDGYNDLREWAERSKGK